MRALGLIDRVPAVCSALRTSKFLKENHLRMVETIAPKSGQSTTVVYTYEFVDKKQPSTNEKDPLELLWGAMKDIFAEYGSGEAYLRAEREKSYSDNADK